MTNEKIKASLDWIGDIHANILIAFATAEQSHEAHKEAGKAISAIETLRALLEAQTSAGEEIEAAIQDLESNVCGCGSISDYSENSLQTVLEAARRYAASQQTRGDVPEGYAIVKIEPTKEMLTDVGTIANYDVDSETADTDHISWWKSMIASSPTPPVAGKDRGE